MAGFNGSGVFTNNYNWTNDANNGIDILASKFDTQDGTIATGLSSCIVKDGQQTTTAQIPFAVGITVSQGTAGTPSINVLADTDTGLYQTTAGELRFASNGTRTATLNGNGLDSTAVGAGTPSTGAFTTLSASGLIAAAAAVTVGTTLGVTGATTLSSTLAVTGNVSVNTNKFTVTAASGNTLVAGTLSVTGHTTLEGITSTGATGTNKLVYDTSPTIVTPTITGTSQVNYSGGTTEAFQTNDSVGGSSSFAVAAFFRSASQVGSIATTNNATSFNTSSDKRLKENFAPLQKAGDLLDKLAVGTFDWKQPMGGTGVGVLAQDAFLVIPEAVHQGDDDPITVSNQWAVDYSKFVPYLIAEIQSLRQRLTTLEGK